MRFHLSHENVLHGFSLAQKSGQYCCCCGVGDICQWTKLSLDICPVIWPQFIWQLGYYSEGCYQVGSTSSMDTPDKGVMAWAGCYATLWAVLMLLRTVCNLELMNYSGIFHLMCVRVKRNTKVTCTLNICFLLHYILFHLCVCVCRGGFRVCTCSCLCDPVHMWRQEGQHARVAALLILCSSNSGS